MIDAIHVLLKNYFFLLPPGSSNIEKHHAFMTYVMNLDQSEVLIKNHGKLLTGVEHFGKVRCSVLVRHFRLRLRIVALSFLLQHIMNNTDLRFVMFEKKVPGRGHIDDCG